MDNWNLSNIYTSSNCNEFTEDFTKYKDEITSLNSWAEKELTNTDDALKKMEYYINAKNDLCKFHKMHIYIQLCLSTDSTNNVLCKIMDNLETADTALSCHEVLFNKFLADINNIDEIIDLSEILKEHSFILHELKNSASHLLSSEAENAISKMKTNGSALWKKQWEQITSTLKNTVNADGKDQELTLTMMRNLAYSNDRQTRINAYKAELESYKKIELASSFALNGIKGEVIAVSQMKGYSSPLAFTLEDSRINEDVINSMFCAVSKSLPSFRKYFRKKGEMLGNSSGLPFYDIFAPVGKSKSDYTYEQAQNIIINAFRSFSDRLADFAENAFQKNWIDVYPHEGKSGGAFCEAIHSIGESRILTNFSGSFNDIVTIAHELGHAFHDSHLYNTSELNAFYPMPIAETASTFCETIINKYMFRSLSHEEKIFILEKDISEAAQTIVDIYSRFLFEDSVFKKRNSGFLSADELCCLMTDAQKKAYGDGLDENYLHPYMWLCKCHYYDADFNYYNFPYAFGILLSKGLYAMYLENSKDFVPKYSILLEKSSTMNLIDLCKTINIDITSEDFWNSGLKIIENDINEFLSL